MECSWFFGLKDWQGHSRIKGQLVNKVSSQMAFPNNKSNVHTLPVYILSGPAQVTVTQSSSFHIFLLNPEATHLPTTSKQGRDVTDSVCVVKALEIMWLCYLSPHISELEFTEATALKC